MNGTIEMHDLIEAFMRQYAIERRRLFLVALLDGHREAVRGIVPDDEPMEKRRRTCRTRNKTQEQRDACKNANEFYHPETLPPADAGPCMAIAIRVRLLRWLRYGLGDADGAGEICAVGVGDTDGCGSVGFG